MDERPIELVRGHAELYNFTDKTYSDNVHKNKIWKEFGEILKKGYAPSSAKFSAQEKQEQARQPKI
jgi:hypothetical protein